MDTLIIVYPWGNPLKQSSGIEKRSSMLIQLFKRKFKGNIIVLAPIHISSHEIHSEKFISYKGYGGLLIDLNPTYYFKLVSLTKKSNNGIKIMLTGPIGIVGALFAKLLFYGQKEVLIIYDAHNVEKERLDQKSVSFSRLSVPFSLFKTIFLISEFLATKIANVIFGVSWEDKNKFVELYKINPEKIKVVPSNLNFTTYKQSLSSFSRKPTSGKVLCVFHGTYTYYPNKEAIELIIRKIAPKVHEAYFLIAGKGVPKNLNNIPSNVKIVGFVDNLNDFLASCDIAVVPLLRGAGTKLKMYDYMKAGLGIVTTKKGSEGLCLIHGKNALIFETINQDFIGGIRQLIYTPKLRKKYGYRVFKMVVNSANKLKVEV